MEHLTGFLAHPAMTTTLPMLLAQVGDDADAAAGAAAAGFSVVNLLIGLAQYVFIAFASWKIFEKLGIENPWLAWIPIASAYPAFQAADEENPLLWTILCIVPCVNIVAIIKLIIAWVKIAQKLGKTPWILLTCLIPVIGAFICFGYLAFT